MATKLGVELLFLGTGNAFSMDDRYWGTILVNRNILFDISPITVPHLKKTGKKLTEIEYIFITHFHGDHFLGLPFFLLDFAYLETPKHKLHIIGPTGIEEKVNNITEASFPGVLAKIEGRLDIDYYEVTKSGKNIYNDLEFSAEELLHGSSVAFGYKININQRIIAYTGDTDLCDGVIDLADGSDVLIIELSNPDQDVPGHMNLVKLEKLREKLRPDIKIFLNHVGPFEEDISRFENIILPYDLESFKL